MRKKEGFTLAEVLVAILILLMVSAVVAGGIPAAKRAYEGVVQASNAETLLSTAVSALRNELGTAGFVKKGDGESVVYYNPDTHTASKIYLDDDTIMVQKYAQSEITVNGVDVQLSKAGSEAVPLVQRKAIEEGQHISYDSVEVSGNVVSFVGLAVKDKSNRVLAPVRAGSNGNTISVRVLSGVNQVILDED